MSMYQFWWPPFVVINCFVIK